MLFRNTMAQTVSFALGYLFSLALAPLLLSRLGLAQFGVWAVTGAIAQYARLLDFGVSGALARFVALYDAQDDRRGVQECLTLGLMAVTAVSVLVLGAALVAAPMLASALGPTVTASQMRVVLVSAVVILASGLVIGVVNSIPIGLRRMVPPSVGAGIGNVINFAASVVALVLSTKLTDYAVANAAAAVFNAILCAAIVAWVFRRPRLAWPSRRRAREITAFGIKSQLVIVAQLVNFQTDKIIIAMLVGVRTAGAYEIGARVVNAANSLGIMTLSAMIPTATAEIVRRGREVVREFYRRWSTRSLGIALPLLGAVAVAAPYLLVAWLGEAPRDSTTVMVILAASAIPPMLTGVPFTLAQSDGRVGLVGQMAALVAALNVALTLALAPVFGLWGVLAGTFAAELIVHTLWLRRFGRLYTVPGREIVRVITRPVALAVGLAVPIGVAYRVLAGAPSGRLSALIGTAAVVLPYGLAYWLLASRMDLLPEQLKVRRIIRRIRRPATPEPSPLSVTESRDTVSA